MDEKHNTEISQNSYPITMFQGGPPHKPYFIAIDNWGQVIIGPNKKMMAIYVVRKLEVLIWFMRTWMLKMGYCYNWYLMDSAWTRVKGNDDMISCAVIVSVSISYNRYHVLASSSCFITHLHTVLWSVSSWPIHIYSIDILLYPYALPLAVYPLFLLKSLPKYNLSSRLRS